MNKVFAMLFLIIVILQACKEKEPIIIDNPPVISKYEFVNNEKVFGFDNQKRYSYCPSVVKLSEGIEHVYFCGNPTQNIMIDNIYHISINSINEKSIEKSVLQPGGTTDNWDDHHTCDPSVVAGNFSMDGVSYKYAMFFLGNKYGVSYNEIGVAFSNDLNSDSWIKYKNQVIKKTWYDDFDQELGNGNFSWGVGQPSAISYDGMSKVYLIYTIGDVDGTRIEWCVIDLKDMNNYIPVQSKKMINVGLKKLDNTPDITLNSDFAIDRKNNIILMVRPVSPLPQSYPSFINSTLEVDYISLSDFENSTGNWNKLIRLSSTTSKYPRNHNAAIERNEYGEIDNWETPTIYYTVSKEYPDVDASTGKMAEWTYAIWRVKVQKNY